MFMCKLLGSKGGAGHQNCIAVLSMPCSSLEVLKQIRELMQIDGITNDEVKSHLQKYRVHTCRVTTNTSTPQPAGLWTSQEQCNGASLKQRNSQSASPQAPL